MGVLGHNATPTSDIVIDVAGVFKTFRQRQRSEKLIEAVKGLFRPTIREVYALKDLNLQVERGEIVAYAGANGAGKSTTVKILSGMIAPDTGTVRVLGMNPLHERVRYVGRIGVVFGQRSELWGDHPVAASFEWKRVLWDIPHERYERMLGFVKELLALDEFFNSLVRELSLGQRMRADLGLALLHEPDILFLDEPTLGLDVLAKRNVLRFIQDLNRERKVTVMLTSHDMSELEQLAGRIVLINKGELAFDGDFGRLRREFGEQRVLLIETPDEKPPTLEVAQWVKSEGNRHEFLFDGGQVSIAELLERVSTQTQILDVETHRAPIDDVIADIYEKWQAKKGQETVTE